MWNEHDIWLQHRERTTQLRREAALARQCQPTRTADAPVFKILLNTIYSWWRHCCLAHPLKRYADNRARNQE
jgi:hypothetical protein